MLCAASYAEEDNKLLTMENLVRSPVSLVIITFIVLLVSARIGAFFREKRERLEVEEGHDLDFIVTAVLTLLALIIGFSFSMAIERYDQRKNYEEAEANAIGTEFARPDLLPAN